MSESREHLQKIYAIQEEFKTQSGDVVIGKMLPELGALVVIISEELDKAQRTIVRLTWTTMVLTLLMAFVGVTQFLLAIR
jgi:hypothetical protein